MRVAIASDHGGYRLKERLKKYLKNKDIDCIDCGTDSEDSCDYPDFAQKSMRSCPSPNSQFCDSDLWDRNWNEHCCK
ncbi:MAG: RpiB/LacA/LacB family sugar-phosphate isomerase [Dialister invisus]